MYIKEGVTATLVVEKSVFTAYLKRIDDIEGFNTYLATIRKKHYDASHHCSAYLSATHERSNDDGEPGGSAGLPILSTLKKADLTDVGAVVVRWFGGVKLGVGGLIRAYSKVTSLAIKEATLLEPVYLKEYEIVLDYDVANKVENLLRQQAIDFTVTYDLKVKITYVVKDDISDKIIAITKGIAPIYIGKRVSEIEVR